MFLIIPGDGMKPLDPLAEALRALPMAKPPEDLFAQISLRLQQRRSRRRWALPMALAASVLLGLLLVWPNAPLAPPAIVESGVPSQTGGIAGQAGEIRRLQADSRDLEAWLAGLSAAAPRDGRSLMASAEIEDLVGLVDVQLSATRNEAESLPLWRQRVALLEDLANIRSVSLASMADVGFAEAAAPNLF